MLVRECWSDSGRCAFVHVWGHVASPMSILRQAGGWVQVLHEMGLTEALVAAQVPDKWAKEEDRRGEGVQ